MKKLLIIPFILIAIIFGFYGGIIYKDKQVENKVVINTQEEKSTISLMFDFGDGKIKTFNDIVIDEGATVFSVMQKVAEDNGLNLSSKDYGNGMGAFIEGVDGYMNDYGGDKYWQYWVNNNYAKIGAGSYGLKGGEVIEWKYVKGQVE